MGNTIQLPSKCRRTVVLFASFVLLDGQIIQLPQNLSSNIVTMAVSAKISMIAHTFSLSRVHKVLNNNTRLVLKSKRISSWKSFACAMFRCLTSLCRNVLLYFFSSSSLRVCTYLSLSLVIIHHEYFLMVSLSSMIFLSWNVF